MFQRKVVEKIKRHFLSSVTFFFHLVLYEIIWKSTVEPDTPQMTIWRMSTACWIHALRICNIYCFSTATAIERRLLDVTSYVLCLSCIIFNLVVL